MKRTLLLLPWLFLVGCANPSAKFYSPVTAPAGKNEHAMVIVRSYSYRDDVKAKMRQGFILMGTSGFTAASVPDKYQMKGQARKVGADLVIYNYWEAGTSSGVRTVVIPNDPIISTSQTHGTVQSYGGNYASYNATTTTTTPGGYSAYAVPYSITYYESHEAYLRSPDSK